MDISGQTCMLCESDGDVSGCDTCAMVSESERARDALDRESMRERQVVAVAAALRRAFHTTAQNPWRGIAERAVQALDELRDEAGEAETYVREHAALSAWKDALWSAGYAQGVRDGAVAAGARVLSGGGGQKC